jgi:alanine racemase
VTSSALVEAAPAGCQRGSVIARPRDIAFGSGGVELAEASIDLVAIAENTRWFAHRAAGLRAPVLAWLLEPACLGEAIDAAIDVSVSSVADLHCIAAASTTRPAEVHLKLDTGLHCAGVPIDLWPAVIARAAAVERRRRLHVRGIWSHLSQGDVPGSPQIRRQQALLAAGIRVAHEQ